MFHKFKIDISDTIFDQLSKSTTFEDVCKGRVGGVLVDSKDDMVPILRTTTKYNNPAQKFLPIHRQIINSIKEVANMPNLEFNNAMIEIYTNEYTKMGMHSDQALDFEDESYIGIYSCYDRPTDIRTLKIQNKTTKENTEISMDHNSVLLFSTDTNRNHLHKIVLDKVTDNNRWLGITFRLSKAYIKFVNEIPYFCINKQKTDNKLSLATEEEQREFYKLRGKENRSIEYEYPNILYTISKSDHMMPI
jgi:hypothetical protein